MINVLFSRVCVLIFGTLYPGYLSFKTLHAKAVDDYVKWVMYWIVFAIFTASETFTDIFLAWLPFYYELKVMLILWLLPAMGNGSSFIYENCVHPLLKKHETRIDHYLKQAREKGQDLVLHYMRETAIYIVNGIMKVTAKNVPNVIVGLLANDNIQESSNIIIEEDGVQAASKKIQKLSKSSTKPSSNNENAEKPHTSRVRNRKTNQSKMEIDYNLNQSKC